MPYLRKPETCSNLNHMKTRTSLTGIHKFRNYNCAKDNINTKGIQTLPPQAIQKIQMLTDRCKDAIIT
jgi:hypothetical protein